MARSKPTPPSPPERRSGRSTSTLRAVRMSLRPSLACCVSMTIRISSTSTSSTRGCGQQPRRKMLTRSGYGGAYRRPGRTCRRFATGPSRRIDGSSLSHMPDDADRDWFVTNIVNARPIAVAWKAEFYPEVVFKKDPNRRSRGINRLELFLELIGYDVPPIHGSGNSAARILYVRDKLTSRQGDPSSQDKVDQWPQTQPLRL
jgi:hypothetical protein